MNENQYDLKKGVDFIGITCVFYCTDGKGNILLQKRGTQCRDEQGTWDCGSGSMDFGEKDFESVVRREIQEEYCIEPKEVTFVEALNVHRKLDDGTPTHWIAFLFVALCEDLSQASVGEPEKVDAIDVFSLKNLPSPLHSKFLEHLELVQSRGYLV